MKQMGPLLAHGPYFPKSQAEDLSPIFEVASTPDDGESLSPVTLGMKRSPLEEESRIYAWQADTLSLIDKLRLPRQMTPSAAVQQPQSSSIIQSLLQRQSALEAELLAASRRLTPSSSPPSPCTRQSPGNLQKFESCGLQPR